MARTPVKLDAGRGLNALVDDAALADVRGLGWPGPDDIEDHARILASLEAAMAHFPMRSREAVAEPLYDWFVRIGAGGWEAFLDSDLGRDGLALVSLDLVQAMDQPMGEDFGLAGAALQEVVADLYDGFLSEVDRREAPRPDTGVGAPLVKWGRPATAPYVFPSTAVAPFGCGLGVLSMPVAAAECGLALWGIAAHETAGHEILDANEGLGEELAAAIKESLGDMTNDVRMDDGDFAAIREVLCAYWSTRVHEAASDVMGVANMGPAAAVALIAICRGAGLARQGAPVLSADATGLEHPAEVLRASLMAHAVGLCEFGDAATWRDTLLEAAREDMPDAGVRIDGLDVPPTLAEESAKRTAAVILTHAVDALDGHSLGFIQSWRDKDQRIVEALIIAMTLAGEDLDDADLPQVFAAHVAAAAILGAMATGDPQEAQARMITLCAAMHRRNHTWHGPDVFAAAEAAEHALRAGVGGRPAAPLPVPRPRRPAAAPARGTRGGASARGPKIPVPFGNGGGGGGETNDDGGDGSKTDGEGAGPTIPVPFGGRPGRVAQTPSRFGRHWLSLEPVAPGDREDPVSRIWAGCGHAWTSGPPPLRVLRRAGLKAHPRTGALAWSASGGQACDNALLRILVGKGGA
ncbi:hypothetical protein ACQ5SO_10530 [Rhodovulum sp. DZ06]|uniref:hypothetical protein n=1 Tax=Rhodovulum sp. DZ06 TaxID=3425126 RepID=UPI003D34B6CC